MMMNTRKYMLILTYINQKMLTQVGIERFVALVMRCPGPKIPRKFDNIRVKIMLEF